MERKQWVMMVYREANLFIEQKGKDFKFDDPDSWAAELALQLVDIVRETQELEDVIKFSVLKNPPSMLWRDEKDWDRVLIKVASECLYHDVKGVIEKIINGEIPKTPSEKLTDLL